MADSEIMPEASNPAWAGIKLAEGQVPVLPSATKKASPFGKKEWGAPIAPIVVTGVPWEAAPGPLNQQSVWEALRTLLNNGCSADSSTTSEGVQKKWDKQQATRKPAEKSWPEREAQKEKAPAKKGNSKMM